MPESERDPSTEFLATLLTPPPVTTLPGLTEGRIVHYVVDSGPSLGDHRCAIVVRVWRVANQCHGYANLMVFMDGNNDGTAGWLQWKTSKCYSEEKEPGTWHWIEHAP